MPDPWMPRLIHDPGMSAGYRGGVVRMQWVKHHDTAGRNSYDICKWGRAGYGVSLCAMLLPKVGTPWQFCEINANTADSGNWNSWGCGLEVERLGAGQNGLAEKEPLTEDQTYWLGEINRWLESEWGVPNVQYRGPQFGATNFYGHVSHYDIAYNPDGLTYEEWDAVTSSGGGTQPPPKRKGVDHMFVMGHAIEAGQPNAGLTYSTLYDTASGVICDVAVEPGGIYGFGAKASNWITLGALPVWGTPVHAYLFGLQMESLRVHNGMAK